MKFLPKLLLIFLPLVILPAVAISLSVTLRGNVIIQRLVLRNAQLELDSFIKACEDEVSTLEALRLENMEFYQISAQNQMITYSEERNLPWGFIFILDTSTGIPVYLEEELDTGITSLLDEFPDWQWRVGVAVRDSYIKDFLRDTLTDAAVTTFILVILVLIVVVFLVRYLVRPVRALADSASRMSGGDLTVRVEVSTQDELGTLGRTFNEMADSLQNLTANLEDQVKERTEALSMSIDELRSAQDLLVRRERMANLGGVVAGVAHEINTPLGVGVTSASFLKDRVAEVVEKLDSDNLSAQDFYDFIQDSSKASELMLRNLERARKLVSNFKQLAVDQSVEEKREFYLDEYMQSIIDGLYPQLKKSGVRIVKEIDPTMMVHSYPGFFYQIFSNLIINSLFHGFPEGEEGTILISGVANGDSIDMVYRDNGVGMDQNLADKVYEPFVTTRAGQGGSGLGLNIVYNLINRRLNGRIHLKTSPGEGVEFSISLPRESD